MESERVVRLRTFVGFSVCCHGAERAVCENGRAEVQSALIHGQVRVFVVTATAQTSLRRLKDLRL